MWPFRISHLSKTIGCRTNFWLVLVKYPTCIPVGGLFLSPFSVRHILCFGISLLVIQFLWESDCVLADCIPEMTMAQRGPRSPENYIGIKLCDYILFQLLPFFRIVSHLSASRFDIPFLTLFIFFPTSFWRSLVYSRPFFSSQIFHCSDFLWGVQVYQKTCSQTCWDLQWPNQIKYYKLL